MFSAGSREAQRTSDKIKDLKLFFLKDGFYWSFNECTARCPAPSLLMHQGRSASSLALVYKTAITEIIFIYLWHFLLFRCMNGPHWSSQSTAAITMLDWVFFLNVYMHMFLQEKNRSCSIKNINYKMSHPESVLLICCDLKTSCCLRINTQKPETKANINKYNEYDV